MEIVIQIVAVLLSLFLAAVKSLRYAPNELSDYELNRQAHAGRDAAVAELTRRALLPTYLVLRYLKEIVLVVLLATLLFATHTVAMGALLSLLYLLIAFWIAARGWLSGMVWRFQQKSEPVYGKYVAAMAPLFRWMTPRQIDVSGGGIASRDELKQLITNDTHLLSPDDKARLLGALDFGGLLVGDAMVPRDHIKTVDYTETVGPLLLDRLHKEGHNIYVVVKKDLNHIKGWLYMADLVPLDPELKEVKDAVRPTVHYLSVESPLQEVLAASLTTGRQIFIAVNNNGEAQGLITLADTLARLNGSPLPKVAAVSTKPEIT